MSKYNFSNDILPNIIASPLLNSEEFVVILDTKGRLCRKLPLTGLLEEGYVKQIEYVNTASKATLFAADESGYIYTCPIAAIPYGKPTKLFPSEIIYIMIYEKGFDNILILTRSGNLQIVPTSAIENHMSVIKYDRIGFMSEMRPEDYFCIAFTNGYATKIKLSALFAEGGNKHFFKKSEEFGYIANCCIASQEATGLLYINDDFQGFCTHFGWMLSFKGTGGHVDRTKGSKWYNGYLRWFAAIGPNDSILINNDELFYALDVFPIQNYNRTSGTLIPDNKWQDDLHNLAIEENVIFTLIKG